MPQAEKLAKAKMQELNDDWSAPAGNDRDVTVQFNPETLKVNYTNQVAEVKGAPDKGDPAPLQFVGAGTTKLTVQLWFDVSGQGDGTDNAVVDVRELTKRVAYFMTPQERTIKGKKHLLVPAVRFVWGSFTFDGVMDSLDETLEYFSSEGVPLRASMSFGLAQQKIKEFSGRAGSSALPGLPATPGTQPLTAARSGESVQAVVGRAGAGADWKAVASANGIENPRFPGAGSLLNLEVSTATATGIRTRLA